MLAPRAPFEERKMFGGLAFMVNTHMACGIVKDDLMVRVGKAGHDAALASRRKGDGLHRTADARHGDRAGH